MNRSRSGPRALIALVGVVAIVAAACGSSTTSTAPSAASSRRRGRRGPGRAAAPSRRRSSSRPAPIAARSWPDGGRSSAGSSASAPAASPSRSPPSRQFVDDFNAANEGQDLPVAPRSTTTASPRTSSQIADRGRQPAGHHRAGRRRGPQHLPRPAARPDAATSRRSNFDMTQVRPGAGRLLQRGQGQRRSACPFAVYPSFIYYNKKLFDEAKLPYPPTKVGDMYDGKPWTWTPSRELGHEAHRRQERQRRHERRLRSDQRSSSGASTSSGRTNDPRAEVDHLRRPAPWSPPTARPPSRRPAGETGLKWFNDGVWKDHFIPTDAQIRSDLLGQGNTFQSGNIAMADVPQLVHVLHQPGRAGQARFTTGASRSRPPATTASDHGQAPRRHVQHPRVVTKHPDEAFKVLDRPGRRRPSCSPTTARSRPITTQQQALLRRDPTRPFPARRSTGRVVARRCWSTRHVPSHQAYDARTSRKATRPSRPSATSYRTTEGSTSMPRSTPRCRRPSRASSTSTTPHP